jgi:hypothetical protein
MFVMSLQIEDSKLAVGYIVVFSIGYSTEVAYLSWRYQQLPQDAIENFVTRPPPPSKKVKFLSGG